MLKIENISFAVGNKKLLEGVSAQFEVGKMNLIVGANGAGKSTLIKLISKQLTPSEGKIYFGDKEVSEFSFSKLSKIRSVLSQNIDLAFPLKVWEVVMMGRYPHFISTPTIIDEQVCREAMIFFDVENLADRNYLTLSGGEKQRVQFARVLSQIWVSENSVRYLLLDEPLTFLDIHYQFQFMKQLRTIMVEKNLIVIGVVHDLNLAARFGDYLMLLNKGKILAQGNAATVFTTQNIATAFHLEAEIIQKEDSFYLYFR
jgi:iron complex transport system ATP-binding protein